MVAPGGMAELLEEPHAAPESLSEREREVPLPTLLTAFGLVPSQPGQVLALLLHVGRIARARRATEDSLPAAGRRSGAPIGSARASS